LLPSFYEYCDVKMMLIQQFGGFGRFIYPFWFNSFIVIPSDLYYYNYQNQYTQESYILDWNSKGVSDKLIATTDKTEKVFPFRGQPRFILTNMSDGSTRYGGVDKYADWRLAFTVEFQIEIPSFIILQSDYLMQGINIDIRTGSTYSINQDDIPNERIVVKTEWNTIITDSTSEIDVILPNEATSVIEVNYICKNRYFHLITEQEVDSTSDIIITIPEVILDPDSILLIGPVGELTYGDHYILINNGTEIQIKKQFVNLLPRQILEIYTYNEYQNSI